MKKLENICVGISGIIMMIAFMGVMTEKFQYIYDGFFNTNGLWFILIAIGFLMLPFIVFYIQLIIQNLKKKL